MNELKILLSGAAIAASLVSCGNNVSDKSAHVAQSNHADSMLYMFTGSYSEADKEGIGVYIFNQDDASYHRLGGMSGVSNPSYLIPYGKDIYSVGEDEGQT